MGDTENTETGQSSSGKWTIMLYLAGDNALSPFFVDQLKNIKDAGYHENVEVLVYFDPYQKDALTRIYNVNTKRRNDKDAPKTKIGDDKDSFVRNMAEDDIKNLPDQMKNFEMDSTSATSALDKFVDYCIEKKPADHFMLFLVGHGVVVGDDAFLPDESPISSIKLKELQGILGKFREKTGRPLDLLGMHSCAMSGAEVVYQLKDTARYMIGAEGLAFVGSWPYRQLLKKIYNGIENNETVEAIIESLYSETYYSARDFWLAGYPLELALINLSSRRLEGLTEQLKDLVNQLRSVLADSNSEEDRAQAADIIQLAHLKAQSYFDENYTDIYDFCLCLFDRCKTEKLALLKTACDNVIKQLKPITGVRDDEVLKRFQALVIHSRSFGWTYQYSHGLSIYFPWSAPTRNTKETTLDYYKDYAFTQEFGDSAWLHFLTDYFRATMRKSRKLEDAIRRAGSAILDDSLFADEISSRNLLELWSPEKPSGATEKPSGGTEKPSGGSGAGCDCPSLKNYPKNVI